VAALLLCQLPGAGSEQAPVPTADIDVSDIAWYAWFYCYKSDEVVYQELDVLPVSDDQDPYPAFDVVVTVVNRGTSVSGGIRARVTLTYQAGPYPRDDEAKSSTPEQRYIECKQAAEWQKPEWTAEVEVPSVDPGSQRRARVATVPVWDDCRRYSERGLWPYRARLAVNLTVITDDETLTGSRMTRELDIDLGC
jgi:hypothetical protein